MGKEKGLLSDTAEQKYRIKDVGRIHRRYSNEYPEMLQGIMSIEDYISYINRINGVAYVPMKIYFLSLVPFFLGVVSISILLLITRSFGLIGLALIIVSSFLSMIGIAILNSRKKGATQLINRIVNEINECYNNFGLTWACHKGVTHPPRYITITLVNANRDDSSLIPMYSPVSSSPPPSSISSPTQINMQTYKPPVYPSAPPQTASPSSSSSSLQSTTGTEFHAIITPNDEPSSPSYPSDPTMFTVIN